MVFDCLGLLLEGGRGLALSKSGMALFGVEADLALERRLAKKLKLKSGRLSGVDDGLADLLDGITSSTQPQEDHDIDGGGDDDWERPAKLRKTTKTEKQKQKQKQQKKKKQKKKKKKEEEESADTNGNESEGDADGDESKKEGESLEDEAAGFVIERKKEAGSDAKLEAQATKYVAPHSREGFGTRSNVNLQVQRRIRGLLNRLSEANVESIAAELSQVFQEHGRREGTTIITDEILKAVCGGPRGNDQFAGVFAAIITGVACLNGIDCGAKIIASFAVCFEDQYQKGDGLALRNLAMLISHLYNFKLLASDLMYDLLGCLSRRLEELDVAIILTILKSCGMALRADDPAAMKDFVLNIQQRTQQLKTEREDGLIGGKRMQFMMETIFEIKNNKRHLKEEPPSFARMKKWLQKNRVEDIQLRTITWEKLLNPNKKGQWWNSGSVHEHAEDHAIEVADYLDTEVGEAEKILQLAARQRMNTEARRAIFCVVMSGEDYLDAFEKLLRLNLTGKQDRDLVRVIVECCLQEKIYNKYYFLLASKLCFYNKNHKFTLQYCLWDHFKQLESMEMRRLVNLAKILADFIGSFSLSLAVLKAVDFADSKSLSPKAVMCFRLLFTELLTSFPKETVWNVFSRIATPELESLSVGIALFLFTYVNSSNISNDKLCNSGEQMLLTERCKLAKKALRNTAGTLL